MARFIACAAFGFLAGITILCGGACVLFQFGSDSIAHF
jgi:hypothetical protein